MPDRYGSFANTAVGGSLLRRFGLPRPTPLRRHRPGSPDVPGPVLLGGLGEGEGIGQFARVLSERLGAEVHTTASEHPADAGYAGLVFDATAVETAAELRALREFFGPELKRLAVCGRVLVLGVDPERALDAEAAAAQAALAGFTRSLAKELRDGGTAQLLRVTSHHREELESTLRFFLSYRSAFVSGQVIDVTTTPPHAAGDRPFHDPSRPLDGKVALVTGAAGGIGAETARVLAEQGATVVCLDVPRAGENLATVAGELGGSAVQLDLTAPGAEDTLTTWLAQRHGGVDIVVHNAGITRDKTLARMSEAQWDSVLDVNLAVPHRVTARLVERELLRRGGRIVAVSSVSGIAGNRGQTNYAASKAGLIGLIRDQAVAYADNDITANAVAPGFIETRMTAKMPALTREVGRRLSSLAQGGLPVDVAQTIAWLAQPGSGGVTGNVVRVCGQSFLGA